MRGSRLARIAVALAMVALATAGLRLSDREEERFEVVSGVLGEPLAVEAGEVTATAVRVGTGIKEYDGIGNQTAGSYVMVSLTFAATGSEELFFGKARVLTRDRQYDAYRTLNGGGPLVPPGFEATDDLIFEVDPADLADMVLELYSLEILSGYSERVRIHLGITAGERRTVARRCAGSGSRAGAGATEGRCRDRDRTDGGGCIRSRCARCCSSSLPAAWSRCI